MTKIKYGSNSGKFFAGLMEGAAQGINSGVENYRLQKGLQEAGDAKDLTPYQRFAKLSSVPGVTPQMVQSGSELLREEAKANAFARQQFPEESKEEKGEKSPAFPTLPGQSLQPQDPNKPSPSLTTEKTAQKAQEGYIPPTNQQRMSDANAAFTSNPNFFDNDPNKAIAWVDEGYARDEKIANAYQKQHENLDNIQKNVVSRLASQAEKYKVQIPPKLYNKIENEAIQATKPKIDGGEGLTEQQAKDKYGKKLDRASQEWAKTKTVGNSAIMLRPAGESLRTLKGIQETMEEYDATDVFAKELQAENGVSPSLSYAVAQPVHKVAALNVFMKNLPEIEKIKIQGLPDTLNPEAAKKTLQIAPYFGHTMKHNEKASPLAIAWELDRKGYDASVFLKWVTENMQDLNLRQDQIDQINTPQNVAPKLNDYWLQSYTGIK